MFIITSAKLACWVYITWLYNLIDIFLLDVLKIITDGKTVIMYYWNWVIRLGCCVCEWKNKNICVLIIRFD
jgi:hypothetical protein